MATHSSIHAWELPWTEQPDELQFLDITKRWTRLSMHAHMVVLFLDVLRSLHTVFHSACYFFVSLLLSSFLSFYCYF